MNSSFWKMGIAKNRPLLLLLFVPGSSRASVRSTATDDREDLTFPLPPSLFVLLIHLGCSPCTPSCSTSVYADTQPFLPLKVNLFYFSKAFRAWPSLVVLHCTFQGSLVSQTVHNWHLYHRISVVIKFLEVALFVCSFKAAQSPLVFSHHLDVTPRKIKKTNLYLRFDSWRGKTSLASNFKIFSSVEIFLSNSTSTAPANKAHFRLHDLCLWRCGLTLS